MPVIPHFLATTSETRYQVEVGPQPTMGKTDSNLVQFASPSPIDLSDAQTTTGIPGVVSASSVPFFGPQPVTPIVTNLGNPWAFQLVWPADTTVALPLPEVPSMRIHDAIDENNSSNSYEIRLNPNAQHIEITLASENSDELLPETMQVFDQTGRLFPVDQAVLGSVVGPKSFVWDFPSSSTGRAPTALYLRISLPTGLGDFKSDPHTSASPYVLRIIESPNHVDSEGSAPDSNGMKPVLDSAMFDYTIVRTPIGYVPPPSPVDPSAQTPSAPGTMLTGNDSSNSGSYSSDLGSFILPTSALSLASLPAPILIPLANGPLPARSTAPFGGVLASDTDPVPPVDPHEAAHGEMALEDPVPAAGDEVVLAPPLLVVPHGAGDEKDGPVIAVRGPGGFPLLATALVAEVPSSKPTSAHPGKHALPADSQLASQQTDGSEASRDSEWLPAIDSSETAKKDGRRHKTRRLSALSGVTWAVTFGVGLMLPDLVAAFQFKTIKRPRFRLTSFRQIPRRPRNLD